MEIKTKYQIGEKVCIYYHEEFIDGMIVRMNDENFRNEKDEYATVEEIFIKAKQYKVLDERHQFDKKIPMYYIATKLIVSYKLDNWETYQEDFLKTYN